MPCYGAYLKWILPELSFPTAGQGERSSGSEIEFKPEKQILLMAQVYSPLTNNSEIIGYFTHVKTLMELFMAMKSLRNVIISLTGAPPRGRTLLSWSAITRPRI